MEPIGARWKMSQSTGMYSTKEFLEERVFRFQKVGCASGSFGLCRERLGGGRVVFLLAMTDTVSNPAGQIEASHTILAGFSGSGGSSTFWDDMQGS